MKIAIPVDGKDKKIEVSKSFGRAPYFLIYDIKSKESFFVENKAKDSRGGAGVVAAQTIVDNDVEALLTPQWGKNAAEVFKADNINIYKTEGFDVKENIDNYSNSKLSLLDKIHDGFSEHGEN